MWSWGAIRERKSGLRHHEKKSLLLIDQQYDHSFAILRYLKKESTIDIGDAIEGWALACYQAQPMGWIKGLKNRINNYYPKEWRIRMRID